MLDLVTHFSFQTVIWLIFKIVVVSLITTILIMIPYYLYKKSRDEQIVHPIFKTIFIFYLIALLIVTIYRFGNTVNRPTCNFTPIINTLHNFEMAYNIDTTIAIRSFAYNVLGNIIWFIPMGLLLPIVGKRFDFATTMIIGAATSIWIELIQYFLVIGISDIDDIICNILGCLIGYICYRILKYLKEVWYEYKGTS